MRASSQIGENTRKAWLIRLWTSISQPKCCPFPLSDQYCTSLKTHFDASSTSFQSSGAEFSSHECCEAVFALPSLHYFSFLFPPSRSIFSSFFRRSFWRNERDSGMDQMDGQSEKEPVPADSARFPPTLYFALCSELIFADAQLLRICTREPFNQSQIIGIVRSHDRGKSIKFLSNTFPGLPVDE